MIISEAIFHHHLMSYVMSEEQLVANGYPRPTDELGMASINRDSQASPLIQPVGSNGE